MAIRVYMAEADGVDGKPFSDRFLSELIRFSGGSGVALMYAYDANSYLTVCGI